MKLRKLLSVLTAGALSLTMCLSMSLTASATEVTKNEYLSGDNGYVREKNTIGIHPTFTCKTPINTKDLKIQYTGDFGIEEKEYVVNDGVLTLSEVGVSIKDYIKVDVTNAVITITFDCSYNMNVSDKIEFNIGITNIGGLVFPDEVNVPTCSVINTKSNIITQDKGTPAVANTPITATTTIPEPTYTVIIPATIQFDDVSGCLEKYKEEETDKAGNPVIVTKSFDVTAMGVNYLFHNDETYYPTITLMVEYGGQMQGADNVNKLPYIISTTEEKITPSLLTPVGTFTNDVDLDTTAGEENKITLTASLNRADITATDTYTGTVTFCIKRTSRGTL